MAMLVVGVSAFVLPASAMSLPTSCNDATNEVIWCGAATPSQLIADYNHGTSHNSAASIENIYSYFHITPSDINNMMSTAVSGVVTKSGDVLVNGKVVAKDAITAGREMISGSFKAIHQGTVFYVRPPSVSFIPNSLNAFVVMKDGSFEFAILSSCGNPVGAVPVPVTPTPVPKKVVTPIVVPTSPNYTIVKTVSVYGTNQFESHIIVYPNTKVEYRIVVTSTGTADVDNLLVKDILPNDDTYVPNSLVLNSKTETSPNVASFFGGGLFIGNLAPGNIDRFMFSAIAGSNQNNINCTDQTLPNVSSAQATSLPIESSTATVSIECVPSAVTIKQPKPITPISITTVTPPTTPIAPTPLPTQLVNTGPGDTIGIFLVVSLISAVGYSLFIRHKQTRS